LKHKPTAEEAAASVKTEKEQAERHRLEEAASIYFVQLSPRALIDTCGQPEQQKILGSAQQLDIAYPFADFVFRDLGMQNSSRSFMLGYVVEHLPKPGYWSLEMQRMYHEAALGIVQDVPCLARRLPKMLERVDAAGHY
jgi:hypothetical protein